MISKSGSAARTCLLLTLLTFAAFFGAGEASGTQLTASWVDNSNGAATTRLERRIKTSVSFAAIADVPPGVTAYVDASVSPGTTYCYRALAYDDADGVSPYSDEVCTTSGYEGYELNLTVSKAGDGAGTVASTPAGILCGTGCSATYLAGTSVTLAATPAIGSTFTGWSGGCAGTAACTLAGNAAVGVTATFTAVTAVTNTFVDVPPTHPFVAWIEDLVHEGITIGCSTSPSKFCPDAEITRSAMAVFLLRGLHGAGYEPPPATGMFADVPDTHAFVKWIEQLAREGVTSGCATHPPGYCPEGAVTRGEMAVFLLRAKHGGAYDPPVPTGMFADVPVSHPFATWIEQLAREGITAGCGSTTYCPDATVTRGQMAVFLVRTLNLPI